MDNLRKALPIRNYNLKHPIVVAFNIHLPHYNAYGTKHYDRLKNTLINENGARVADDKVLLLPNVVNVQQTIETRAASLAKSLQRLAEKHKFHKCHLFAHSFTGVDARAAISLYGAKKQVSSLSTISSPHAGMKLIDLGVGGSFYADYDKMERVFEILGITEKASHEFATDHMRDFNSVVGDAGRVGYYSVGSRKKGDTMTFLLKPGFEVVNQATVGDYLDGLVQPDEATGGG